MADDALPNDRDTGKGNQRVPIIIKGGFDAALGLNAEQTEANRDHNAVRIVGITSRSFGGASAKDGGDS